MGGIIHKGINFSFPIRFRRRPIWKGGWKLARQRVYFPTFKSKPKL